MEKLKQNLLRYPVIILFLLALAIRLPLLHTEFFRTPDAIEYINVAQNIIQGQGVIQSIKWHFFTSDPVVTSALQGKPLFTAFVFAAILAIGHSVYAIQATLLILGAINVVLFYMLATRFLSPAISFLASVVLLLNPNLLVSNRLLLSEPIFLCFVLVFFLVFYEKTQVKNLFFLGIIAGFAFLTRTEGILLLLTACIFRNNKSFVSILLLLLGFIIPTLPYFMANTIINHSPFYNYNVYHLQVYHFADGMWNGFNTVFPTKQEFIIRNISWIIATDIRIFRDNFLQILSLGFLGLLSVVYFFQTPYIVKKYTPLITFSVLFFIMLSLVWSAFQEPERHFTIIYPLLLIPVFDVFSKQSWRKIAYVASGLTILAYIILSGHRLYWTILIEPKLDNKGYTNKESMYQWITLHTKNNDIIAATNPWMTYLFTDRPSVILPSSLQPTTLTLFTNTYHVGYILSDQKLQSNILSSVYIDNGSYMYKVK